MWAEAMSSERSDSAPVISDSRPGRSRPSTSMTVNRLDSVLLMSARGSMREGLGAALRLGALGDHLRQPALARQHVLDQLADALGAAPLVLVAVELAADQDRVERLAVGGGEDLRVDDVAAGRGAGAGDHRQQARMVGRQHGDLGDRLEACVLHHGGEPLACASSASRMNLGMAQLVVERRRRADSSRSAARDRLAAPSPASRPAPRQAARAPRRRARRAALRRSRRSGAARSRSRACAAAGPSSRSRRPGPTPRMSPTVSTSSSFSRSGAARPRRSRRSSCGR